MTSPRVALLLGTTVALTLGATQALAAPPHRVRLAGHGTLLAGPVSIGTARFSAVRTGSDPTRHVTGQFVTSNQTPLVLAGPITCLDVEGDRAGFVYPLARGTSPSALGNGDTAILISLQKGAHGAPNKVGFLGPLPTAALTSCAPQATPMTFDGPLSFG